MRLEFDLTIPRADIHVSGEVPAGTTTAVLGPNGAGKSSLLGAITGTVPATGRLVGDGRDLLAIPTHRRRIGLLGQRALLFPHLSVLDNVAFGPRSAGVGRRAARERAADWLDRLGAQAWASRRPSQLSGGQAQRVALARALAAEPEVMLLDEPFAAIDADAVDDLRDVVRREVRTTCLIVTHDLPDALTLADQVIVLTDGRVAEAGPTAEVIQRPRSAFAARLAGVNLITGMARDRDLTRGSTSVHGRPLTGAEGPAVAVFPPRAVAVFATEPHGSPRNTWPVRVRRLRAEGAGVLVDADHADLGQITAEVTPAAVTDLDLTAGAHVWFTVKAQEVELLPRPPAAT